MNKHQKDNLQLVFIVGSGRSGTTLLRNILKNHPQIGVTPELRFFDSVLADKKNFKDLNNSQTKEKFIKHILKKVSKSTDPLWRSVNLNFQILLTTLFHCNSHKEIFLALAKFTSSKKDPKILIEKSPPNIFFLEEIICSFPQCKIIHVVRDGREFCASAKKKNWSNRNINLISWWRESIRVFDEILKRFPQKRNDFLEIKYEDLTQNPKQVLNQIFSFLDIGVLSESFLTNLKNLPFSSSFSENSKPGLYQSKHFREYFSLSEQEEIESLLHSALEKRGYSVVHKKPSIFLQFKLLLEILKLRTNLWFRKKGYFWLYFRFKKLLNLERWLGVLKIKKAKIMKLSFIKTLFMETYRGESLTMILANNRLKGIKLEGKILDLGSGKSPPSYFRFLQLAKNSKVISADISVEKEPDLKIDLEKPFPIKENEFDYVLCFNLLEHIFNYKQLIGESERVLKENGKLIGFVPFLKNIHPDPNDYFRYTISTLRKLFKETGFKEIKVEAIGCGPFSVSYSVISFVFPQFIKFIIVAIVMIMDSLLITIKRKLDKNQYPLGYFFECQK